MKTNPTIQIVPMPEVSEGYVMYRAALVCPDHIEWMAGKLVPVTWVSGPWRDDKDTAQADLKTLTAPQE